jgi:phosphopantetheinyl transferase
VPVAVRIAYVETPDAEPLGVRRRFASALFRRLLDERFGAGVGRVESAESGQPLVIGVAEPAFVSLTHTDRVVAAAVATARVGIDVEDVSREASHPGLFARVCSAAELRWLERQPDDRRNLDFLRLWTRKEAYGKAIGVGLGFDLRSTNFVPDDDRLSGVPGRWHATTVDLGSDVVAAVVVEGRAIRVAVAKVDHRELARLV